MPSKLAFSGPTLSITVAVISLDADISALLRTVYEASFAVGLAEGQDAAVLMTAG